MGAAFLLEFEVYVAGEGWSRCKQEKYLMEEYIYYCTGHGDNFVFWQIGCSFAN